MKTPLCIVAAALLAVGLAACSRDPHATGLPPNVAEISKVQAQLDKLPPDERDLVLAYLQRSKGDVLPAKFADPDAPLTARTFGEAIELQRAYKARHFAEDLRAAARHDARETAMEPLRQALSIELVLREIQTLDQVSGRQLRPGQAINNTPVQITTYRLRNTSEETIKRARGTVTVRTESDPASLMGISSCYFDLSDPIPRGQSVEVPCSNLRKPVGPAERDYVAMPESSLILTWEPKLIELGSGKVLKSAD